MSLEHSPDRAAYSVADFCSAHSISRALFYKARLMLWALQKFINHICGEIVSEAKKATLGTVIEWVEDNASEDEPIEIGIPDCDGVFIQGEKLKWNDQMGRDCNAAFRSLERYIARAKMPS